MGVGVTLRVGRVPVVGLVGLGVAVRRGSLWGGIGVRRSVGGGPPSVGRGIGMGG